MKKLKVYQDEVEIASKEASEEGKTSVTIPDLTPDTNYPEGTYQAAWEKNGRLSEKVNVPEFTTNPILVTGVTFTPNTASIEVDKVDTVTANVKPSTATNAKVTYESNNSDVLTVDSSTGEIRGIKAGQATVTATANDQSGKSGEIVVTVTEKAQSEEEVDE